MFFVRTSFLCRRFKTKAEAYSHACKVILEDSSIPIASKIVMRTMYVLGNHEGTYDKYIDFCKSNNIHQMVFIEEGKIDTISDRARYIIKGMFSF